MRRHREYRPRKDGKKFTEWTISVDGVRVKVPVRAIKGDLFWVDMPEYKINMRNSDIQELKAQVTEALKTVNMITWEDILVLTFEVEEDDFPSVGVDTKQNGVDSGGKEVHRDGSRGETNDGHYVSGRRCHWHYSGFQVVLPKTKENVALTDQIMKAAGKFSKQIASLFGITYKNETWSAKQDRVEAASEKTRAGGMTFTAEIGKPKAKKK